IRERFWVNSDGSTVSELPNGVRITEFRDGYKVWEYPPPDRSIVEVDEKGRVTYVTDGGKPPKERSFYYDEVTGELNRIKGIDGHNWYKTEQNEWVSDQGKRWHGKLEVSEDGRIHYLQDGWRPYVLERNGRQHSEGFGEYHFHSGRPREDWRD